MSLKVIFLSSLTISDASGIQISCLKMISELKKMGFLTFSKIKLFSPLMCTLVFQTKVISLKFEKMILSFILDV